MILFDEFYKILPLIIAESNNLYIEKNEHIRSITEVETAQDRFYGFAKEKFPQLYKKIIDEANSMGISMYFSGIRHFKH